MAQTYGGQAVIEGVMIRGARAMAVAVRRPNGTLAFTSYRLGSMYTGAARRVPLLRGILVLWETVALGMRALAWSAAAATDEPGEDGREAGHIDLGMWVGIALSMALGVGLFFLVPVIATAWLERYLASVWVVLLEGAIRLALLVGYVWAMGRSDDIQRVFQYHGAGQIGRAHV